MQAQDLIELGAFVAVHQNELMVETQELDPKRLEEYWVASKCRFERWSRSLVIEALVQQSQSQKLSLSPATSSGRPSAFLPLASEILGSEILTRIWSAMLCSHDDARHCMQASPIARSVFKGHMEARCRVLRLLASPSAAKWPDFQKLDRFRRKAERWCDVLLAHTNSSAYIADFAVDPARALRYAKVYADHRGTHSDHSARVGRWDRIVIGLRDAFPRQAVWTSPNVDLHRRIVVSVLGDFTPDQLAGLDIPMSLWLERVQHQTAALQQLIDCALDNHVDAVPSA